MTYKISKSADPTPNITKKIDLSTVELVLAEVEARRPTQGVLIYAVGKLHKDLSDDSNITVLDSKIEHECLRSMDKKTEGFYPVYLASDKY